MKASKDSMTVGEVAQFLGRSVDTIRGLFNGTNVPPTIAKRIKNRIYFNSKAIEKFDEYVDYMDIQYQRFHSSYSGKSAYTKAWFVNFLIATSATRPTGKTTINVSPNNKTTVKPSEVKKYPNVDSIGGTSKSTRLNISNEAGSGHFEVSRGAVELCFGDNTVLMGTQGIALQNKKNKKTVLLSNELSLLSMEVSR